MNSFDKRFQNIRKYLDNVFDGDIHAKRIGSLASATLGVMASASLAVSIIGQALAQARGLLTKHAIKQVDRLLSNEGIVVWTCSPIGSRRSSARARWPSSPWIGPTMPTTRRRWC